MSKPMRGQVQRFRAVCPYEDLEPQSEVTILPHEDGKVGEFEEWWIYWLIDDTINLPSHVLDAYTNRKTGTCLTLQQYIGVKISNAIGGLFEERIDG